MSDKSPPLWVSAALCRIRWLDLLGLQTDRPRELVLGVHIRQLSCPVPTSHLAGV